MEYPEEIEHGIMFHHFHNEKHQKGPGSISQEEFEGILNFIGLGRILCPLEWLERLRENRLTKEHLCLTFDDALLCQFEVALPVLEKYRLTAFWFVYSSVFDGRLEKMETYRVFRAKYFQSMDDFYALFFRKVFDSEFSRIANEVLVEREIRKQIQLFPFYSVNDVKFRLVRDRALRKQDYERIMDEMIQERRVDLGELSKGLWMSNGHLRDLSSEGHVVGLHSYSHPTVLANLAYEQQFDEYQKNYLHIKEICRCAPVTMAHPCDSYNEYTLDILKRLGIVCGFRSNMFPRREGERLNPNQFEIAREDHANILKALRVKRRKIGAVSFDCEEGRK